MTDSQLLSPWIRRFLTEHLVIERNLARNTQKSYRDTLRMLLPFVARAAGKPIDRLDVVDLSGERIRDFLSDIEENRQCGAATRNQRLAAIHSLASFIGLHSPEHVQWYGELKSIRTKKGFHPLITYLEKEEMDAILSAPDPLTDQGRRDYAVLLFLYNTSARADEVAHVQVGDLMLGNSPRREGAYVLIHGKGNKPRRCPLWPRMAILLAELVYGREPQSHAFLNRRGEPLTRFGIYALVERHVAIARRTMPSIAKKRISPHSIRHTTATHLLRAGVDINTIRAWLGHVSLTTTNIYTEVDLQMKARALACCEIKDGATRKARHTDAGLMAFLQAL
ncbi:tyrosine-type recombinase/integrase [Burkholderia ubonensis]|uniref:tyrosine-type recombinase/integrase n=1 Tax=Burkholderia ubonensis TaxID=101571 RepID=UPI0007559046|nr:tyrosine-type recombinase/integrase [Burkholderia ubonensis]KVD58990.1 integrase [Burkholderia ubonensis]